MENHYYRIDIREIWWNILQAIITGGQGILRENKYPGLEHLSALPRYAAQLHSTSLWRLRLCNCRLPSRTRPAAQPHLRHIEEDEEKDEEEKKFEDEDEENIPDSGDDAGAAEIQRELHLIVACKVVIKAKQKLNGNVLNTKYLINT